ncbi:FAD-binding oxidoreductase [Sphingorhabdus contaminans]|uniref:FAD-binding oxidoreductase n=1 Tax=Sphingorhabdus contaminans TaxID=1343899 RepID=UPI003D2DD975
MTSVAITGQHNLAGLVASGVKLLTDDQSLDFYAHDVFERGATPVAVVRPDNKQELARAVAATAAAGLVAIPRGGGMSYTGGITSTHRNAVLFDLAKMDRVLAVNETDMTVTVEAGCTWSKLYETLKPMGLRTPMWGTLSGLYASVGGGMSQNCIFWGSTRHGMGVNSCVAMEVVLADGSILKTGKDFARSYGPDLTGLFCGDTGALGIKAEITLRLVPEAKAHGYASFLFDSHAEVLGAMAAIERAGIASECFGFDPKLNAIRMKRDSLASDAKQLVGMMKAQGSVLKALKEGAKVVAAGRNFLDEARFSLHILTEGRNQTSADSDLAEAVAIARAHGGSETDNTIPKIIRANPFVAPNSILGPNGERWAPIHGLVPHSQAVACYDAIEAFFEEHRAEMESLHVHTGTLFAAVGGAGAIIEPCIYWPDARNPWIEHLVEDAHLAKLPDGEANPAARELMWKLKKGLVDLFFQHEAAHFQIARTYRFLESLDPSAQALLKAVKAHLDPNGRMNPGALGI